MGDTVRVIELLSYALMVPRRFRAKLRALLLVWVSALPRFAGAFSLRDRRNSGTWRRQVPWHSQQLGKAAAVGCHWYTLRGSPSGMKSTSAIMNWITRAPSKSSASPDSSSFEVLRRLHAFLRYFGTGKPFMQTTVRSASSGFACVKPRLAVQSTSPFKTKLVLLSNGAFTLLAISMRCEPSGDNTQISFRRISET